MAKQKVYRTVDFKVREYRILEITETHAKLLDVEDGKEEKIIGLKLFSDAYFVSKIPLLRELLAVLEEKRNEVVEELGEYELKCLTGEILPRELLQNLKNLK